MKGKALKRLFALLLAVFLIGILLRMFVIDSYIVQGNSMEPTINGGDYIFVNKLAYRFGREPGRGDIIVTRFREKDSPSVIKRVIGLPGERLEITPGHIAIKERRDDAGERLEEKYLLFPQFELNGVVTVLLDPKEYFLLGDNRLASIDSRDFGPVDHWDLYGKVLLKLEFPNLGITRY